MADITDPEQAAAAQTATEESDLRARLRAAADRLGAPAYQIAYDIARKAQQDENPDLSSYFRNTGDQMRLEDERAQRAASKQSSDAVGPVQNALESGAILANDATRAIPGHDLIAEGANRLAQSAGLAPQGVDPLAAAQTLEDQHRSTAFQFARGMASMAGGMYALGGATKAVGTVGKAIEGASAIKGAETLGRVLQAQVPNFVAASAALNLGEAGGAALSDLFFGESQFRPRAGQVLAQLPTTLVQSTIMGATIPLFQWIGKQVQYNLLNRWGPANAELAGKAISELGGMDKFKALLARGVGGAVEWAGFSSLPDIHHGGHNVWTRLLTGDDEERHAALMDLATSMATGFVAGVVPRGATTGNPRAEPGQPGYELPQGLLIKPKPTFPPGVEMAFRKSAKDALDVTLAQPGAEEELISGLLNVARLREAYGYEKPGSVDALLAEVGKHEKAAHDEEIRTSMAADEAKHKAEVENRPPLQRGRLSAGMGIGDAESLQAVGELPFTASMTGTRLPPVEVPGTITRPGTRLSVNVGTKAQPYWVEATMVGHDAASPEGKVRFIAKAASGQEIEIDHESVKKGFVKRAEGNATHFGDVAPPTGEPAAAAPAPTGERQRTLFPTRAKATTEPKTAGQHVEAAAAAGAKAGQSAIERLNQSMSAQRAQRGTAERQKTAAKLIASRGEMRKAQQEAYTDPLTGLANARAHEAALKNLVGTKGRGVLRVDGTNTKTANEKDMGGHANGDKVIQAQSVRLSQLAQQAGLEGRDVFRVGGDEFSVVGEKKKLRKLSELLASDQGKVSESKFNGKTYEHRLIAGEPKDTNAEADKSQQQSHERYYNQAEQAGLGISRPPVASPSKVPATEPAKPANPSGEQKGEQPAKPKEEAPRNAAKVPANIAAPKESPKKAERRAADEKILADLKGSGFTRGEEARKGGWLQALGDPAARGKVYKAGSWRLVTRADVLEARNAAAREPGDAAAQERMAYVERAAQARGKSFLEPEVQSPRGAEAEEGFPSPKPASTAPAATLPSTAPQFADEQKSAMERTMIAMRESGVRAETIDESIKALTNRINAARNAAASGDAEAAKHADDLEARRSVLTEVRERKVEEEKAAPAEQAPVKEEKQGPEAMTEKALRRARRDYELERATQAAVQQAQGRGPATSEKKMLRSLKKQIDDLSDVATFVKQRAYKPGEAPKEVVSFFAPTPGDYLSITDHEGRNVTGIVAQSKAITRGMVRRGEAQAMGRRIKLIVEDGSVRTVRLSDVAQVRPGDAMNFDWSKGVELTPTNFVDLFAGQSDANRSLAALRERTNKPGKTGEGTYEQDMRDRQALLAGEGDRDSARRTALNRSNRIRSGKADSVDWQLEAQAYLAPDDHRFELPYSVEGPQTPTLGHRVSKTRAEVGLMGARAREARGDKLSIKQRSMLADARMEAEAEAAQSTSKVAVATYYDPKAKLRDPQELRKAAEAGDVQAHKDYYGWYSNMQRSEQMRGVEEERLAQALAVKRNGMGFSLVEGDPEHDQRIWIVQRTLSPGGRYGRPNPLVADRTENGTVVVRDATPDEISEKVRSSEKFRGVMEGMIAERHSESEARLTAEAHQNYITRSISVLNDVRKEIGRGLIFGETMPPGPLYDAAREWQSKHPQPQADDPRFKDWKDEAFAFLRGTPPKGNLEAGTVASAVQAKKQEEGRVLPASEEGEPGVGGLGMRMIEQHLDLRSGKPLAIDSQTGNVVTVSKDDKGIVLRSVIPGYVPLSVLKQVAKVIGTPFRLASQGVTDVTRAIFEAAIQDPVRNILFRPDKIGYLPDWLQRSKFFRAYEGWGRSMESALSESENASTVRRVLNRYEGNEATLLERQEGILKPLLKIPHEELLGMIAQHNDGIKTDARLEPYQAFMREMWDEMNRLGIVPEGVDSRWKDRYVHLGRWLYTKDSVGKKLYELKNQLREALRTGGDTEALSEAVGRLQEISDRYQEMMGPGKVVIGQTPLEAIGDSKTRALIKKGFLRWRTHDTFADAVKAGLDTTNPIDLLKDSMFFESMAVAKHRLFDEISKDPTLAMKPEDAPSWYKQVDASRISKHAAWRKLHGKSIEPFLLDQLYAQSPDRGPLERWLSYLHGTLKANLTLFDPSNYLTNLIGNPVILMTKGMALGEAQVKYARAFTELLLSEPWMPAALRQRFTSDRTAYGKNRPTYMREGWITHANDATRELVQMFDRTSPIREFGDKGYEWDPDRDVGLITYALRAAQNLGERSTRIYRLLDAAARATLHEHLTENGMPYDKAVDQVNSAFDVSHLPRYWSALRRGVHGSGLLADSFVSFKYAMARNMSDVIARTPSILAQVMLFQALVRKAVGMMYGKDDEEMDQLVDASLPRTGNQVFDYFNRKTAFVTPTGLGPRTMGLFRYAPMDAALDLIPGVRPLAMGGLTERGQEPKNVLQEYVSRSVLTGPATEYYMDRDSLGRPVQERMNEPGALGSTGILRYLLERQGPAAAMASIPGASPAAQLARALAAPVSTLFRKLVPKGGGENYRATGTKFKPGDETPFPDANAERYDPTASVAKWLGFNISEPNIMQRLMESARAKGGDIRFKEGRPVPVAEPGEEGRTAGRQEASQLTAVKDYQRGLRMWAAVKDLEAITTGKDKDLDEERVRAAIEQMAPTRNSVFDLAHTLMRMGNADRGAYLIERMFSLNAMPGREPRLPRPMGATIEAR